MYLENNNGNIIYKFNCEINDIDIKIVENLVVINNFDNYMLLSSTGDVIIPSIVDEIVIIDDNKVSVSNYIMDLNQEYLELDYEYYIDICYLGRNINRKFNSIAKRDKFLNDLKTIENDAYKKINNLEEVEEPKTKHF